VREFWNQFNKSTIISGILALAVTGAVIYLAVRGLPIPDTLAAAASVIVGFFFGSRSGQQAERIERLNHAAQVLKERDHD